MTTVEAQRRERFEALFAAHHHAVRAYALRRGAGASAEDVVADTFLIAWRRLERVGDDPLPWLLGVARRVLSNEHRGERRRLALADRLHGADAPPPAPVLEAAGPLQARLVTALERLSPAEREALLLVAWEGLTPGRAARAAGCSAATFRVRLHRARRRVAHVLDGDDSRLSGAAAPFREETR